MEDSPAAVVITNQELDQLRKVAKDGGVGETLRELEDTLEETTDMVDELRVNLCKTQVATEDLKQEAAAEKALQAGLKQEVAAGKERVEELKQQLADADAAQALLRKDAAADTRLEDKDDEVSELKIKLLEAETEVTELKIKHSASAEQLERDAAQLRRELKAAAAAHAEVQRELAAVRATLEVGSDRRATLEAIPLAPPPLTPPPLAPRLGVVGRRGLELTAQLSGVLDLELGHLGLSLKQLDPQLAHLVVLDLQPRVRRSLLPGSGLLPEPGGQELVHHISRLLQRVFQLSKRLADAAISGHLAQLVELLVSCRLRGRLRVLHHARRRRLGVASSVDRPGSAVSASPTHALNVGS